MISKNINKQSSTLLKGQRLSHTGSWAFSTSGFDYWSSELFRIHGLDPSGKAPTREEYLALMHPDDREFVEHQIQEMLTACRAFDFTKRIVRPDSQVRSVRCVGAPVIKNERLKQIVGIAIDVTEHEVLTQELRRRELHLAEAQTLSHTGSFGWNVSSDEQFWSDETFRIFEFARSCKITLPMILERVHPQDRSGSELALADAANGNKIDIECRLLWPDGKIKYLHDIGNSQRDSAGNLEVIGAVTDVTARKLTEIELRRSKGHLSMRRDSVAPAVPEWWPLPSECSGPRKRLGYMGTLPGRNRHPNWFCGGSILTIWIFSIGLLSGLGRARK